MKKKLHLSRARLKKSTKSSTGSLSYNVLTKYFFCYIIVITEEGVSMSSLESNHEGESMIIKQLTQSGNSKAIVIDKALLQAAGLDENALFQVVINPNGGMLIQSVQATNENLVKSAFRKVMKKNHNLLKRLADK